ncbi:MAG: hypothetical protein A3F72_13635 [Bacteroidetes bacterium RIFCSPLOWO2_12_FULL_35_15]|nr:MAG: hypothetical protein A3F72_13635 [Bacteroidetes bacterium RIFCSPLOWO2_12_FULL_35_15]
METNPDQTLQAEINSIAEFTPSIKEFVKELSVNKTGREIARLHKLISHLAKHLQNSKEISDIEYLRSDEGKKIIEQILEIGTKEEQPEKLLLLSIYLTNFCDKQFIADKNKQEVLQALAQITPAQAEMLRDVTEWLVLASGRDIVKQSTDHKSENIDQPYEGYIMESLIAILIRTTIENTTPHIDALLKMNVFVIANNGEPIQHFGQSGRGYKPSKLGLQLLEYLGLPLTKMPEKKDFRK